jgi:hypothetical protein
LGKLIFLSYLLCITFFLVFCIKRPKRELYVIFIYILYSLGFDFVHSAIVDEKLSFLVSSIFTIGELSFCSYYFYLVLHSPVLKKTVLAVSCIVLIIILVILLRSEKKGFDSFPASLESITFILFSVIFFFEQINKPQQIFIYSSPNFWIVLGIMVYMSGTLFLFIMANNLPENELSKYWIINDISNILTNFSFSIAFIQNRFVSRDSVYNKSYNSNDSLEKL